MAQTYYADGAPMGPKPASTVLTPEQEAIAVAFREPTLLPRHGGPSTIVYTPCKLQFLIFAASYASLFLTERH